MKVKKINLHVVVSVESFVADGARELGGADEDLGWCRDPILGLSHFSRVSGSGRGGGRPNMEGDGDSVLGVRVLVRVALAGRAQREQGGALIIAFKIAQSVAGRHVSLHVV